MYVHSAIKWGLFCAALMLSAMLGSAAEIIITRPFKEKLVAKLFNGVDPAEFNDYSNTNIKRAQIEYILLHKALKLGGYKGGILYSTSDNYSKGLQYVQSGRAAICSLSVWFQDAVALDVYISDPVIRVGETAKGVYCLPVRDDVLSVTSAEQLRQFRTVSYEEWTVDWSTAVQLNLPIDSVNSYKIMHTMLKNGQIDYLFRSFTKESDLSVTVQGVALIPVPNLKLVLRDSRHFIVSKRFPDAHALFSVLQKGLRLLRAEGIIEQAYRQNGFINEKVEEWEVLNPVLE